MREDEFTTVTAPTTDALVRMVDDPGGSPVSVNYALSNLAQVTEVDASTGRLAIAGVEMGDTGFRDVQSLLPATWVPGGGIGWRSRLRRVGYDVEGYLELVVDTGQSHASGDPIITLPTGFRPPSGVTALYTAGATVYADSNRLIGRSNDGEIRYYQAESEGATLRLLFRYMTNQAWPATLPGVPL